MLAYRAGGAAQARANQTRRNGSEGFKEERFAAVAEAVGDEVMDCRYVARIIHG